MNQMHKGPIQDAAKKRRGYLRRKTRLSFEAIISGGLAAFCALLGLIFWLMIPPNLESSTGILCVEAVIVALTVVCVRQCYSAWKDVSAVLYVPPVAEQLAALPAEEILVRGSDPPAASPDELVRASASIEETPASELLRAEQGIQD